MEFDFFEQKGDKKSLNYRILERKKDVGVSRDCLDAPT